MHGEQLYKFDKDGNLVPESEEEFLRSLDEAMLTTHAGFYTSSEELFASYDAYFAYLEKHPDSKIHKREFHKLHPEHRPISYHGPEWCSLTKITKSNHENSLGFRQVNYYDLTENASIKDVCHSYLLDFRYGLNTIGTINMAMREVEDPNEDRLPRMGFLPAAFQPTNFQQLKISELEDILHTYSLSNDWGDDLAFYRESAHFILELIKSECSSSPDLFYINKDDLPKDLLSESVVSFGYCIIIVAMDNTSRKMLIIDLGSD